MKNVYKIGQVNIPAEAMHLKRAILEASRRSGSARHDLFNSIHAICAARFIDIHGRGRYTALIGSLVDIAATGMPVLSYSRPESIDLLKNLSARVRLIVPLLCAPNMTFQARDANIARRRFESMNKLSG